MSKGTVSILISAAVLTGGLTLVAAGAAGVGSCLLYVGGSALIGAVTNRIAIRAIFTPWPSRRAALPGTGLIERNRDRIVAAIADAVAEDLITPETLAAWLREAEFFDNLRNAAAAEVRPRAADGDLAEPIRQALRERLGRIVEGNRLFHAVREFFRSTSGVLGKIGNATGLTDYDSVAYRIVDGISERIQQLVDERGGWLDQQVAATLGSAAERLERWDLRSSPVTARLIERVAAEVDVREIVLRSLGRFSAAEVRRLVESLSRDHLSLLEVWGAALGALAGGAIWLLSQGMGLM